MHAVTAPRLDAPGWRRPGALWSPSVAGGLLAAVLATVATVLGWEGADWPAQVYRVAVFRTYGFIGFDTGWYGGHSPVAYSSLFPPLAATIGVHVTAIACAAVATWTFDRVVRGRFGTTSILGTLCFAAGTVAQIVVGQLAFLLGLTFALVAVLMIVSGRRTLAVAAAVACALSSFVAALFLVLGAVTWAVSARDGRRDALLVGAGAVVPVLVITATYRQAGRFPFPITSLVCVLVACAATLFVLPPSQRLLRRGALVYAIASLALFVVPTPVGGVMTRLGTTIAVPLVWSAVWRVRRALVVPFVVLTVVWQFAPAFGAMTTPPADHVTSSYFTPLVDAMHRADPAPARLEIALTRMHWEAAWVAPSIPLARGWERQLDIVDNSLFYRGHLTAARYRAWLDANGIQYVALSDLPLDASARAEAAIMRSNPSYLRLVWHDVHWRLWKVVGSSGLVSGPAHLTSLDASGFTVVATGKGAVDVRVRWTPTWSVGDAGGHACLTPAAHGWTGLHVDRPGTVRVTSQLLPTGSDAC